MMRKAFAILGLAALVGCTHIEREDSEGVRATTVISTPVFAPANTITIVERPGKEDIVYASNDRSIVNTLAPAVVNAVGGVIAATQGGCSANCGDFYVSSGATSVSTTETKVKVKVN